MMTKKLLKKTELYIFLTIVVLCLAIQLRSGQFFTANNIIDILRALIIPGMFSIGAFMVIVSGGIDVSFPAVASLSMYATTRILVDMNYQGGVWFAFLMSAGFGLVLGALNGVLIANLKLPTLIVTLGTQSVFRGIMQGVLKSVQIPDIPDAMYDFGQSKLFVGVNPETGMTSNMPAAFLLFVAVIVITFFIMRYTLMGRGIYAIGADENSAARAGFKVKRIKFLIYCYVGLISGVVGLTRVCLMQQCHPTNLLGTEMLAIAAVALGGTNISGGSGTITGTVLGITLLITAQNSLLLLGIPTYWQEFFTGLLIIIGVAVSAMQVKRARNRLPELKTTTGGGAVE